jgi:hypothetical protein
MPRMQRLDTTFRTTMAYNVRVLGGRLCSHDTVRPAAGGRGAWFRGTLAALKRKIFVDILARRKYDSWHRIHMIIYTKGIRSKNGELPLW